MSADLLSALKQHATALTVQEKIQLAYHLLEQARSSPPPDRNRSTGEDSMRQGRLEWLKAHRDVYGGQYVALDGTQLVAVGPSYRTARENAKATGKPQAFVTYVPKPDEVAEWGGWG